jgi:pilus assembly protein CpaB
MLRVIILVLALLTGGATLFLLQFRLTNDAPDPAEVAAVETVQVLVFAMDLPRGTMIDRDAVRWQEQLLQAVPEGALTAPLPDGPLPDAVEGKLLRSDVLAGEMVRPDILVEGSASFMALAVSPGMRAVAIRITPEKVAGGFIQPEDRVDLIHTLVTDVDGDGVATSFSQTLIENVRVLAVGTTPTQRVVQRTAEEQEAIADRPTEAVTDSETITLELTEPQAEMIYAALANGQVALALRAIEDHGAPDLGSTFGIEGPPGSAIVTPDVVETAEPVAPPAEEPAPDPAPEPVPVTPEVPATATVRVIEAGEASDVVVDVAPAAETEDAPATGQDG